MLLWLGWAVNGVAENGISTLLSQVVTERDSLREEAQFDVKWPEGGFHFFHKICTLMKRYIRQSTHLLIFCKRVKQYNKLLRKLYLI